MQLSCPNCGTRDARVAQRTHVSEYVKALVGIYQLRCRRCRTRWETSVWASGDWRFARCPRCYRQELTTWSREYYYPPAWITMKLRLGATPYRCAACRCNFASFRPCKEKFAWRHQTRIEVGGAEVELTPTTASLSNLSSRLASSVDQRTHAGADHDPEMGGPILASVSKGAGRHSSQPVDTASSNPDLS